MRKPLITIGVIIVIIVTICIIDTVVYEQKRNQENIRALKRAQEQGEKALLQEEKEKILIDYFNSNKEQVISSIKALFLNKKYQAVITQASKYSAVENKEMEDLYYSARTKIGEIQTKKILAELKIIPVSEYEKNLILYRQLVELHPTNNYYKYKVGYYSRALVPNETGMWSINYYVDNFGEPTEKGYITNTHLIRGTFSNTATQDSRLNVCFLITGSSNISIQLYEYAGNNPVKGYSSNRYTVQIQDKDGNRRERTATNYSDRLTISFGADAQCIHDALIKGGTIKFRIIETDVPTTIYKFEIKNANWYDNAYRILKGK